jgi:hypothetical protein
MIDFAHQEVLLFLALLAFGNVLQSANETDGPPLRPGALEIGTPQSLLATHKAVVGFAVAKPEPQFDSVARRSTR